MNSGVFVLSFLSIFHVSLKLFPQFHVLFFEIIFGIISSVWQFWCIRNVSGLCKNLCVVLVFVSLFAVFWLLKFIVCCLLLLSGLSTKKRKCCLRLHCSLSLEKFRMPFFFLRAILLQPEELLFDIIVYLFHCTWSKLCEKFCSLTSATVICTACVVVLHIVVLPCSADLRSVSSRK